MKSSGYIPVRLSHVLRHCSVGAIMRGPEYVMTMVDTREWTDRQGQTGATLIPYVDQVRSALAIEQELRKPPVAREMDNGAVDGVCLPAIRFPKWMSCPVCGGLAFAPWRDGAFGVHPRCTAENCAQKPMLEQLPWVMVHAEGHLADVPWHRLAHAQAGTQEQRQCRPTWERVSLFLSKTAYGWRIRCAVCGAWQEFRQGSRLPWGQAHKQPWLREPPWDQASAQGKSLAHILEINDTRVHAARTQNALVIPPESRVHKGTVLDRLYCSTSKRAEIDRAQTALARKSAVHRVAQELRCSVSDVLEALEEIDKGYPLYGKHFTPGLLLENEYKALSEPIPDVYEDEDLVTRHRSVQWKDQGQEWPWHGLQGRIIRLVDRLVSVTRLKEIMVFQGFQRPVDSDLDQNTLVPPDIVAQSQWLPAIELYGEGIFFTLDHELLSQWATCPSVGQRSLQVQNRFARSGLRFEPEIHVSPEFIFLHTLAHVLIKELEATAGYPAASLKERIFCSSSPVPMAGVLIYVAVPDVVGSLGGLAEQAEPKRFLALMDRVLARAQWCSLDPVCSEHLGQGPHLLNRAACHACALIPETSCIYGNILLDRAFLIGETSGLLQYLQGP